MKLRMDFFRRLLIFLGLGAVMAGGVWFFSVQSPPLRVMVGQMILLGFTGADARAEGPRRVARQVHAGQVGGVIFLGWNFKSRAGVFGMTRLYREAGGPFPPFLVIDMEGGLVQRLGSRLGYEAIPSAEKMGATMTPAEARLRFDTMTGWVREAGFNLDLGPVVDLGGEPLNPISVQHRTYGSDPAKVVTYAREFMAANRARGILSALKHFPGHGSSRTDSHDDFVDVSATWKAAELEPYRELIASGGVDAVMTGHLLQRDLASDGFPVSLSRTAIEGVLRDELHFDGLVISDDLQMKAISKHYGLEEAVVRAINAGTDVLMVTNTEREPELPGRIIAMVLQAVEDGRIEKSTIRTAWRRIQRAKARL
ncbi:MAG: glycoside hydrolase family 3 N-terminal domain-containing protein [Chthoniobacterales bacterium]